MAAKVNLDALIAREDFEIEVSKPISSTNKSTMSINDLESTNLFYHVLRKPDFQRETCAWDAKKICDFIESFIEGDLIPAIILWKSSAGYSFIVDGSHRISALLAWINDDYGDGSLSNVFYDGRIPTEQREVAEKTRELVYKRIGIYQELMKAFKVRDNANPEMVERAIRLATQSIYLQWIPGDNSSKAEESFFKINQKAAPIDISEKRVLLARRKPNGIATRAIIRGGKGHKYWSTFPDVNQKKIEKIATEIQSILFNPELEVPIKTLDLPIAGKIYSAQTLPLILDFVEMVNGTAKTLLDDVDGSETIKYLTNCKKIAQLINSNFSGSLGLAPFVYFYSIANGRHKPASFYAMVDLIIELDQKKKLKTFIDVRSGFETLIIGYDYLIQQIVRHYRSAIDSYPYIKKFYMLSIDKLKEGKSGVDVVKEICALAEFNYLTLSAPIPDFTPGKDFSEESKSEAFLQKVVESAPKCHICGGYLHRNSISIDHDIRKREGGRGEAKNAQLTHPYCNSGIKN